MRFRWTLAPPQPDLAARLATLLSISPLLAQCLLNRGLVDASIISSFLQPRLKHLSDPFLLPNMDMAVERLLRAHQCQEAMVIFGDYDVDGVASTALLLEVFRTLGWRVNYYLPHRMDEGYGLITRSPPLSRLPQPWSTPSSKIPLWSHSRKATTARHLATPISANSAPSASLPNWLTPWSNEAAKPVCQARTSSTCGRCSIWSHSARSRTLCH